ncbi:MAG: T9SS type A sorting domain-containing protein, partial [Bacteroidia bacterium]|nr:T9SS type A sorting domain-containing protein [Bacteroidia bacterium]
NLATYQVTEEVRVQFATLNQLVLPVGPETSIRQLSDNIYANLPTSVNVPLVGNVAIPENVRSTAANNAEQFFATVTFQERLHVIAASALDPALAKSIGLTVYPNPVSGASKIRYELPNSGEVKIEIVDITGRTIVKLAQEIQQPGIHEISLGENLSNGLYFLKFHLNEQGTAIKFSVQN